LALKNDQIELMERSLNAYQSKLAMLKHSIGLLYDEHKTARQTWDKERQGLQAKHDRMSDTFEQSQIRLQEFEASVGTFVFK
jgi:hypothetical protein